MGSPDQVDFTACNWHTLCPQHCTALLVIARYMNLIERIDIALERAGKTRGDLAGALGISVQAISNMKRRAGATLRPENCARAARFLRCDLYWLCTGEGGAYVPELEQSLLVRDVATWLDEMPEEERAKAFVIMYCMKRGNWPKVPDGRGAAHTGYDGEGREATAL
jgi:transcriptional regulator with XRE-family HTH domain